MGFAFTLAYIVLTMIAPQQFGQEFASYRPFLFLAGITALASLPAILTRHGVGSSIQTYLLIGFIIAIGLSQVANGWFGGTLESWLAFIPSAFVFFFIVANVTTARRLKIAILTFVATCLFLGLEALCGYYGGFQGNTFVLTQGYFNEQILRLRSVGYQNDPNDFAQILLMAVPLLFITWRRGRVFSNSVFVLAPAALLLWCTYLTHSRGALIGLVVLLIVAARKRLGTIATLALGSVVGMGMMALDFSGGRGISASEGADRMSAWATGLELFKSGPLFGIGFGRFAEVNNITAHNSFVLCLTELGLVGATIWLALLIKTTMELNNLIKLREETAIADGGHTEMFDLPLGESNVETFSDSAFDADQAASFQDQPIDNGHGLPTEGDLVGVARMEEQSSMENVEYDGFDASSEALPSSLEWPPIAPSVLITDVKEPVEIESVHEVNVPTGWVVAIRLALVVFMTTSWFLSRTYATPIYLLLGLATAAVALDRSAAETRYYSLWIPVTLAVEATGIIFVYLIVRLRH